MVVWGAGSREPGWAGRAGATHIGFITAGLKDEFFWPVLPTLHRGIGGSKAGGPKGQPGFAVLFLQNTRGHKSSPTPHPPRGAHGLRAWL